MEKFIGILGLSLCMILCGAGSAFGLYKTGSAAAGVLSEDNKKFSKIIVLALLPATQGIYGFVLAVMKIGAIAQGWNLFGAMIVTGVLAHIAIQVVLNIAVVTNVIPNTGITLPFISYGGTSVLFLMVEMGMVLSVSNRIRLEQQ